MEEKNQYDEISLRELIEGLLKNKKLIILITVIAILIAFVYTFFVADTVYESKVIIQVNQGEIGKVKIPEDISDVLDDMSLYSYTTMEAYKEQIVSSNVMSSVIKELSLDEITVEQLAKKVAINNSKDSNLIVITVKDSVADLSAEIANSFAKQFSSYIVRIQKKQLDKSTEIIEAQLKIEKIKLDEALEELKQLLSESRDVSAIQNEIDINVSIYTRVLSQFSTLESDYLNNKFKKEEDIRTIKSKIISYGKVLKNTSKYFVLNKNILDDTFATELATDISSSLDSIMKLKISDEEMNPVYLNMLQKITDEKIRLVVAKENLISLATLYKYNLNALNSNIKSYGETIDGLKVEIAEKKINERIIERKVEMSQKTYDAFSDKLELTRVAEAAKISENSVIVVAEAVVPNYPIAPRKSLSLAIGGILGLMLGIFVAIFKEYWNNSKV